MAGSFPLAPEYFGPIQITPSEAQDFQAWGDVLLQRTIDAYHQEQFETHEQKERKWKVIKSRGELTSFRRRKAATTGAHDECRYLTTGRIDGTLDEVMMARYADTTDSFRRMSAVYREDLVDCAVLHVIEPRSATKPFCFSGFKWMTVRSPGKGLVKNRDVCWFEHAGLTTDRNGKEIGYILTESVDLPTCPPFNECVRAKFSVCYLFKRNKSGGVKIYMRGNNNAGGKVMDWIADMKSAELWLRIDQAQPAAHAYIASELVRNSTQRSNANKETGVCEVCHEKSGGLLGSERECAVCHRFTCSRCITKKRVLSTSHDFTEVQKELFCKKCLRLVQEVNLRDPDGVRNICSSTSASSFSTRSLQPSASSSSDAHIYTGSEHGTDESRDTNLSSVSTYSHNSNSARPPPPTLSFGSGEKPTRSVSQGPPVMLYEVTVREKSVKSVDSGTASMVSTVGTQDSFISDTSSYAPSYYSNTDSSVYMDHRLSETHSLANHSVNTGNGALSVNGCARGGSSYVYSQSPDNADYSQQELMAQMINLSVMAEKSLKLVQENDKLARKFGQTSSY